MHHMNADKTFREKAWREPHKNFISYVEFKSVKLRLKIDLVPYPARAEGLVNTISYVE